MSNSRYYKQIFTPLFALVVLVASSASPAFAAGQSSLNEGDKCTVTSGPNKGKTGTYGSDGWCEGSWGGTECGTNKCKVAAASVIVRVAPSSNKSSATTLKLKWMPVFASTAQMVQR